MNVAAPVGLGVIALAALLAGAVPLAVVVVVVAALLVLDVSGLFARSRVRPIVLAAALPGVGLPIVVAISPDLGWQRVPGYFAFGFLLAFLLLLPFGRRDRVTEAVGTTLLAALLVGLGASSLLLLHGLPDGFRWVLGLAVVVIAADVAVPLAIAARRRAVVSPPGGDEDAGDGPGLVDGVVAPIVLAAAAGALLSVLASPPFDARVAVLLGLAAVVATAGGRALHTILAPAQPSAARRRRLGDGALLGVLDGLLLAAPAAYVLARSAVL